MVLPILVWYALAALLAAPILDSSQPGLPVVSNIAAAERSILPALPAPAVQAGQMIASPNVQMNVAAPRSWSADEVWALGTDAELSARCGKAARGPCSCAVANPDADTKTINCSAWFGLATGQAICKRSALTCTGDTTQTGKATLTCAANGTCSLLTDKQGVVNANWNDAINS